VADRACIAGEFIHHEPVDASPILSSMPFSPQTERERRQRR